MSLFGARNPTPKWGSRHLLKAEKRSKRADFGEQCPDLFCRRWGAVPNILHNRSEISAKSVNSALVHSVQTCAGRKCRRNECRNSASPTQGHGAIHRMHHWQAALVCLNIRMLKLEIPLSQAVCVVDEH